MGVVGICLLCSSHNGATVDVLGPFPNSLKTEIPESHLGSSDSSCWLALILSKVLRIPEDMCEEFVVCFTSANNNFRVCDSCALLVNQDALYRQQILKIKGKVDALEAHVQKAMVQSADENEGISIIYDRGERCDVACVITKLLNALDNPSLSKAEMDESIAKYSDENMTSKIITEINSFAKKHDFNVDQASSSQDHLAENVLLGRRPSDDPCHHQIVVGNLRKFARTPDNDNPDICSGTMEDEFGGEHGCSSSQDNLPEEGNPGRQKNDDAFHTFISGLESHDEDERARVIHSTLHLQTHLKNQLDIQQVVDLSMQRIASADPLPNKLAAHPHHSSNKNKNLTKRNNNRKKLFLNNGTLKKRVHCCSMCPKKFSHSSSLSSHIRTHTGVRPFKCQLCDKTFSESTNLITHMRTHTKERPFKCEICLKTFTTRSNLKKHTRVHTKEEPPRRKCTIK